MTTGSAVCVVYVLTKRSGNKDSRGTHSKGTQSHPEGSLSHPLAAGELCFPGQLYLRSASNLSSETKFWVCIPIRAGHPAGMRRSA